MKTEKNRLGVTERQYAAYAGISRGAVSKAKGSGRLALFPDGSIDAAASDIRLAQETDPSKRRNHRPVPEAAVGAVAETLREPGMPTSAAFLQARTANEVMKAQERRIRLQKLKGEVVDRARATALVFRLARQERDAWIGWPSRVAALMASELGVGAHAMQTVLERHVREHLASLAEVRAEFR
jgi:hypothetical protein